MVTITDPSTQLLLLTSFIIVIRFFVGILGGSFVPCEAWTLVLFHNSIVGTANAIVAGLGNSRGGATCIVMVALCRFTPLLTCISGTKLIAAMKLHKKLSEHLAWRVAFLVVPLPSLLLVGLLILIFGTDHPNGRWR